MINSVSSVNIRSALHTEQKIKKPNVAKEIALSGLASVGLYGVLTSTKLIYPKVYKFLKYGLPTAVVGGICYCIYDAIKDKNNPNKQLVERDNRYINSAIAGGTVAAVTLPIVNLISISLISLKTSKSFKDFGSTLKLLFPQVKNYIYGMYTKMLSKIKIKNLSPNKTIALGTLVLAGIGAVAGVGINWLVNKFIKKAEKQ